VGGWVVGWWVVGGWVWKLTIKLNSVQLELELGLSLAKCSNHVSPLSLFINNLFSLWVWT
jgi:hypothetical protein